MQTASIGMAQYMQSGDILIIRENLGNLGNTILFCIEQHHRDADVIVLPLGHGQ
ncbi:MAG: hypothetical protein AseanaTS_18630 [Candidatus Pelagadaptatus aseana]